MVCQVRLLPKHLGTTAAAAAEPEEIVEEDGARMWAGCGGSNRGSCEDLNNSEETE